MSVQIIEKTWSNISGTCFNSFINSLSEGILNQSQANASFAPEESLESFELPTLQLIRQDSSPAEYFEDSPNHAINSQLNEFRERYSGITGKMMCGKIVTQSYLEKFRLELLNSDSKKEAAVKVLVIKVEKLIKDIKSGRHRYVPRPKKIVKSLEEEEVEMPGLQHKIQKYYSF